MIKINKVLFLIVLTIIAFEGCKRQAVDSQDTKPGFTFAFITDIHLQPERYAVEGFRAAIDSVNTVNPDFVITGGDLIMDALGQTWERSDSLYDLYSEVAKDFEMPVHNTLGNHEIYGIYEKSGADRNHPEFGEKMFEQRLGKSYYSFDHKGWHFMVLNSVDEAPGGNAYIGSIDSVQVEWIKQDLKQVDAETPIVISTHIPFATVFHNVVSDPFYQNAPNIVVKNTPDILKLFENHNLKLVLQGHMHILEEIVVNGVTFVTGGAVSGRWWSGDYYGVEEGFVLVHTHGNKFDWEYVDYGWEAKEPIEEWN